VSICKKSGRVSAQARHKTPTHKVKAILPTEGCVGKNKRPSTKRGGSNRTRYEIMSALAHAADARGECGEQKKLGDARTTPIKGERVRKPC